jgi:Transposase DDE domain
MREKSRSEKAKRDIRIRQHLMERSFARATRYGFDRARWRGLWRMQIQEYLVCAVQNIQVFIKHMHGPSENFSAVAQMPCKRSSDSIVTRCFYLIVTFVNRIKASPFDFQRA